MTGAPEALEQTQSPEADTPTLRGRAFGLPLEVGFSSPLFAASPQEERRRPTVLSMAEPEEVRALCGDEEPVRVAMLGDPSGEYLEVRYARARGFLVAATGFGEHFVSLDGLTVTCAPPRPRDWAWQRILVAQVLPIASAARGFELLHASAVACDGHAFAFVGPPGAGKTSTAMLLMLRGAGLVTDDVLAIEAEEAGIVAHPGVGLVSMRVFEDRLFERLEVPAGRALGRAAKSYWLFPTVPEPLPLGALYLLERARNGSKPCFERLETVDPAVLLRNSFASAAALRDRLVNQLAVFACLERHTPVFKGVAPEGLDAQTFAAHLERHIGDVLRASEGKAPD